MRKRGRFERKSSKGRMNKWVKIILIFILIIILLLAAAFFAANKFIDDNLDKITQVSVPKVTYTQAATEPRQETTSITETTTVTETTAPPTEPPKATSEDFINILVVGDASREGEMERRADTAIIVTINTFDKTVTLTSLLRDTLVSGGIRYQGKNIGGIKINTVYHLGSHYLSGTQEEKIAGSMYLMNQFLYKDYGIEVDHNVEVGFDAFRKVIDILGGIRIKLTEAEVDYLNNGKGKTWQEVAVGENYLMGDAALSYARMRKAEGDADSDIKRTERQRYVIKAIFEKLIYMDVTKLQSLANEVLPMIATSMTSEEIKELMLLLLPMLPELQITGGNTCPAYGTYKGEMKVIYKETGIEESVLVIYDWDRNKQIMRSITEGKPHPDETVPATTG